MDLEISRICAKNSNSPPTGCISRRDHDVGVTQESVNQAHILLLRMSNRLIQSLTMLAVSRLVLHQ